MIIVNDGKMMINCLRPLVLTRNIQSEERGRSTERTFRFAETREHPKQVGGSEGQCFFFSNKLLGLELLFLGAQEQTRMCKQQKERQGHFCWWQVLSMFHKYILLYMLNLEEYISGMNKDKYFGYYSTVQNIHLRSLYRSDKVVVGDTLVF